MAIGILASEEMHRLLYDLLAEASRKKNPLLAEPALFALGTWAQCGREDSCTPHLLKDGQFIVDALDYRSIQLFSHETILVLPDLVRRIAVIIPDDLCNREKDILAAVGNRLDQDLKVRFRAERIEPKHIHCDFPVAQKPISVARRHIIELALVCPGRSSTVEPFFGKIVGIHLDFERGSKSNTKKENCSYDFDGKVLNEDDFFYYQIHWAVKNAERVFYAYDKISNVKHHHRMYHFKSRGDERVPTWKGRFTGGSAGLAFALLVLSALNDHDFRFNRRSLRTGVVATGKLDKYGNILPVSNEGLKIKVRAAYFSPIHRYFVLPSENLQAFNHALEECREGPGCELIPVPVSSIMEAFMHPCVTIEHRIPKYRVLLAWTKRLWKLESVLAAAIIVFIILSPYFDREFVRFEITNGTIDLINGANRKFRSHELGYFLLEDTDNTRYRSASISDSLDRAIGSLRSKLWASHEGDIDGDGRRELVFIGVESDSLSNRPKGRLHVHVFEHNGVCVHHITLLDSLVLYKANTSYVFEDYYLLHTQLYDFNKDGVKEIVISTTHYDDLPSAIIHIDPKSGEIKTFAHIGYIPRFAIYDFDRDGSMDIVAGGVNVFPLEGAVAVVLDPSSMNGSSPAITGIRFRGLESDPAKYYIHLPASRLRSLPEIDCDKPEVNEINLESDGLISFGMIEGGYSYKFHFNDSCRCVFVEPVSNTKKAYDRLRSKYKMPGIETQLEELRSGVRYWNGKKWVNEPTPNKSNARSMN